MLRGSINLGNIVPAPMFTRSWNALAATTSARIGGSAGMGGKATPAGLGGSGIGILCVM